MNKSYDKVLVALSELMKLLPDAKILYTARLGAPRKLAREKCSLPILPAASLREGMVLFDARGTYDVIEKIETHTPKKERVHDLEVRPTHNFIANDITTHNSIYSWRGANIQNVLRFERHFPNAKTILLEENYRSTKTIVGASNDIISKNKNRVEKNVFTSNHEGEKLTVYTAMSGGDEAEYVALTAKSLIEDGASPSSIAVLFRTNFQSRALEEAFLNYSIPYQVLGTKFFERKEVKDVLSYLRLALNPGSTADLSRVANTPTRGIGKVTLLKMIEGKSDTLTGATKRKVDAFNELMMDIANVAHEKPVSETLKYIMKASGIEGAYKEGGTEDDLSRIENLRELVSLASRYSDRSAEEGAEALLEDAALQSDQDELKEKESMDAVRLMTVHAAKGLEFPYVFVTGLEEGLFPHERLSDEKIDEEEERRLFYVALTRAEKKVFLSYAHMRTIFGSQRLNAPSSFLSDIDPEFIEHVRLGGDSTSGFETVIEID